MRAATKLAMRVTVVGGGNSTSVFATLAKKAGHDVSIWSRKPEAWSETIGFENWDNKFLDGVKSVSAKMDCITSDPADCIPNADLVFLAGLPIHHNPHILSKMKPHLSKDKKVFVGSICAYGGFNWVAAKTLGQGEYSLFGTQLIPWTCGTKEYGKTGLVFGAKRFLRIATEGGNDKDGVKDILAEIVQVDSLTDTDFLASSLWPNNPSLHPPILYGLFKDWDGKTPYDPATVPKRIYAEMTDESAMYTAQLDEELSSIVSALFKRLPHNPHLQMNFSLKHCIMENYKDQVEDTTDLASVIRTTRALAHHYIPYTQVDGGVVPTLAHKFFETDLPYGLCMWKDIAKMVDVDVPLVTEIILWNQKLIDKEYLTTPDDRLEGKDIGECIIPSRMGLTVETLEHRNRSCS